MFSRLNLEQLEELAEQSQALVDKAMANGNDVESRRRSPSLTPVTTHPPDAVQYTASRTQRTALEGTERRPLLEAQCAKLRDPM